MRVTVPATLLILAALGIKSLPALGAPAPLPAGPRILEMRGLWYNFYGVDRAIARAGGAILTQTWAGDRDLSFYSPASPADLSRYRLLIIANMPGNDFSGALPASALQQYVENGGSVLILGGLYGFGPDYHGTPLETMAPVTFGAAKDLENGSFPIAAVPGGPAYALTEKPSVLWIHDVTAKPDARVLLTAGGKPLLIEGDYGKGRVAVFAGTVLGDPATGQIPFWQWDEWPRVLGDTMTWLLAPHTEIGNDAPAGPPATTLPGAQPPSELVALLQSADLCRDSRTASTILSALAQGQSKLTPADVDKFDERLRPYLGGLAAVAETSLLQSEDLGRISLGLRLLGQIRPPGALSLLTCALKTGDLPANAADAGAAGGDGLTPDPMPAVADQNREGTIRLNALIGLGRLGDPAALTAIEAAESAAQKGLSPAGTFPAAPTMADLISEEAAIAALHCGDSGAADAALNAVLAKRATLVANMIKVSDSYGAAYAAKSDSDLALTGLPDSVLPAFAKSVAECDDPWAVPVAFTVFGKAFRPTLSVRVSEILKTAKLPAVADLASRP